MTDLAVLVERLHGSGSDGIARENLRNLRAATALDGKARRLSNRGLFPVSRSYTGPIPLVHCSLRFLES